MEPSTNKDQVAHLISATPPVFPCAMLHPEYGWRTINYHVDPLNAGWTHWRPLPAPLGEPGGTLDPEQAERAVDDMMASLPSPQGADKEAIRTAIGQVIHGVGSRGPIGNATRRTDLADRIMDAITPFLSHAGGGADLRELCYLYWSAYHAGHHDTVEALYTDVHNGERFTYHEEAVRECLSSGEMPHAARSAPSQPDATQSNSKEI